MKLNADQLYNAALRLYCDRPGTYPTITEAIEGAFNLKVAVEHFLLPPMNTSADMEIPDAVQS